MNTTQQFERTMGINLSNMSTFTDVGWDRVADIFTTVRISLGWAGIESSVGVYAWTYPDAIVDAATSRGLTVLFILNYGNSLYGSDTNYYPPLTGTTWTGWSNYVTEVVTRYKDKRVFFEVWNEPQNLPFWKPWPDAQSAGSFSAKTCKVIRDANPSAYIVAGGGLALNVGIRKDATVIYSEEWLTNFNKKFFEAGGAADADCVSIHPYTIVQPAEYAHRDLDIIGRQAGKPIIVTEMGYSYGKLKSYPNSGIPPSWWYEYCDEHDIATQYVRYMIWAKSVGIPVSYWFHYDDFRIDPWLDYVTYPAKFNDVLTLTYATGTCTLTSRHPHGLTTGDRVTIAGSSPYEYDGAYYITRTGTNTFTYTPKAAPSVATATGLITWRSFGYSRIPDNYGMCEERSSIPPLTGSTVALEGSKYLSDAVIYSKGALFEDPHITFCDMYGVKRTQAVGYAVLGSTGAVTGVRLGAIGSECLPTAKGTTWDCSPSVWTGDNSTGWTHNALAAVTASTLTSVSTTATFTSATPHGFPDGALVTIAGATPDEFNKAPIVITVGSNPNSFTYTVSDTDDAATGTITATRTLGAVTATTLVSSTTTATFTVATGHGFVTGDWVTIAGANLVDTFAGYAGTFEITKTSSTAFTYQIDAGTADTDPGGTNTATLVTTLRNSTAPTTLRMYRVDAVITGRTAGTITAVLGDQTPLSAISASKSGFKTMTADVTGLVVTPTATFDGTVVFSMKLMPEDLETGSGSGYIDQVGGGTVQKYLRNATVTFSEPPTGGTRAQAFATRSILRYYNTTDDADAWTIGTGWAGDNVNGWQHTAGNTATLESSVLIDAIETYTLAVLITGRTAGTITVTVGGVSAGSANISASVLIKDVNPGSTASVVVTPHTDFDGKVSLALWRTDNSAINCVHVWEDGAGYTLAPDVTFSEPPELPEAKAVLCDGSVVGVYVTNPGAYPNYITLGVIENEGYPYECDYSAVVAAPIAGGTTAVITPIENFGEDVTWPITTKKHLKSCLIRTNGIGYENPVVTCDSNPAVNPVLKPVLKGGTVYDIRVDNPGGGFTYKTAVTDGLTYSSTTATFVSATAHGFLAGDTVVISGVTPATDAFNGTFNIVAVSTTTITDDTFTYTLSAVPAATPAAGSPIAEKIIPELTCAKSVATITSAAGSYSSTTLKATITTDAAHGLAVGDSVILTSVTQTTWDGTFTILTVPSTTTFTYSPVTAPTGSPSDVVLYGQPVFGATMGSVPLEESPKPVYYVAKKMRELLEGYTFVAENSTNPNVHEIEFTNGTSNVVVLWAEKLIPATVKTWLDASGEVHIAPVEPGFGYVSEPTVVFPGQAETLIGHACVDAVQSFVDGTFWDCGFVIKDRGHDYTSVPTIVFSGGGSPTRPAQATALITDGWLSSVFMNYIGVSNRGYTMAPTIRVVGGGGRGAKVECTLGAIGTITLTGNTGFTTTPTAYLEGGFPTYTLPSSTRLVYKHDGSTFPWSEGDVIDVTEDPIYVVYDL